MNKNLKFLLSVTILSAATSLITSPAQAELDSTTGYTLTLGGFFYQPKLGSTQQFVGNFAIPNNLNNQINNGLGFGFNTSILYQITNTPYNILASYKHFDTIDDIQSATTVINRVQTDTTLNEVDMSVGRTFTPKQSLNLRVAVGARYADIDYKTNFIASPANGVGNPLENGSTSSNYSGIGPNISLDASYVAYAGFGVAAHANAAALVGNRNLTQNDAVLMDEEHNYTVRAARNVVGNFSGELGLAYTYITENYKLNGEVGYTADYYSAPIISSNTANNQTSTSILFHGPYFKFSLGF